MEGHQSRKIELHPYIAPDWAMRLKYLPKYRVQIAQPNTPIQKWNLPGVPESFNVHIKRDDTTGSTLCGNKCRSLEFLLADAIDTGCSHVITWASAASSNHGRTTALACAQLGLTSHLILGGDFEDASEVACKGNLLLGRLCGANMYFVPNTSISSHETEIPWREETLTESIKWKTGERSYTFPVSGANKVGMFGYLSAFEELMSQDVQEKFDDIVVTSGTRTTAAGFGIGNLLTGSKLKIHCIDMVDKPELYGEAIEECFHDLGLGSIKLEDIVDVIDGHQGHGHGLSTAEELRFIREVCVKTGIVLDPVYTGKGALGLVKELQTHSQRFQGKRILFVHTGGIFGLFDGQMDSVLKQANSTSNRIKLWPHKDMDPYC